MSKLSAFRTVASVLLACLTAHATGCRRRVHGVSGIASASASAVEAQLPLPGPPPAPLVPGSAIVPSAASYADGGARYGRPLTHDLLASMVKELGGQPVKAQIDDLRDDTYYGSVFVRQGDRILQLDARPSDAIAIALGSGAPLFVSRSVMLSSGVPREEIEKAQKAPEPAKRKTPISM